MYEQEVIVTTKYGQCPELCITPARTRAWVRFRGVIFHMDAPGIREVSCGNMTRRIARQGYSKRSCPTCTPAGSAPCVSTSRDGTTRWRPCSSAREQPDQRDGDGRHRESARLSRRAGKVQTGSGRLRRPLHERPAHHQRGGILPAPHQGGGIALRRRHHHRQGRFAAPPFGQDQGRALLRFRRETDNRSVPPNIPGDLAKLLAKTNVRHEIKTFAGTEHGFAFAERPVYNTLAAEETWDKMFAMWDRCLKKAWVVCSSPRLPGFRRGAV